MFLAIMLFIIFIIISSLTDDSEALLKEDDFISQCVCHCCSAVLNTVLEILVWVKSQQSILRCA